MRKKLNKFLIIIIFVIFFVFVGIILCLRSTKGLKTEVAVLDTVSDSIEVRGIALRKETEIFNESEGFINFLLNDGDKINKGGLIAEVYKSEQEGLLQKEIKRLDSEIKILENFESSKRSISTSPNYIEKQSYQLLKNFAKDINNEDYQCALKNRENILNLLNERQSILGKSNDVTEKIQNLKNKRDSLMSSLTQKSASIISSESGYFLGNVDGFENLFDIKNLSSLNTNEVNEMLKKTPSKTNALAKIVNLSYWYFVCNIKKDQVSKFNVDDYVNMVLPFSNVKKVSAKVVAINQEGKNSDAVLILKCSNIDKDILNLRFENVRIDIKDYTGIKLNKSAIHENMVTKSIIDENGESREITRNAYGVYVLNGRQLSFKEVELLYFGEKYAVCKKSGYDVSSGDDKLKLYDEVVVEGYDLYDKKIVK